MGINFSLNYFIFLIFSLIVSASTIRFTSKVCEIEIEILIFLLRKFIID